VVPGDRWHPIDDELVRMVASAEWRRLEAMEERWCQWNGGVDTMMLELGHVYCVSPSQYSQMNYSSAKRVHVCLTQKFPFNVPYAQQMRMVNKQQYGSTIPGSTLLQLTLTQLIYKKYLISHTAYNLQCMCQRRKSTFLEYLTKPQRLTEKKISVPATSEEMEDLDEVAASKEGKRCQGNSIGDAPPSKWSTLVGTQSVHY